MQVNNNNKYPMHTIAQLLLLLWLISASVTAHANNIDVEDPYICKNTLANFPTAISQPNGTVEQLINAVRLHCLDEHQASIALLSPVLEAPKELSTTQLTYAYILHSINLNNVANDSACDNAKLSMAHAANTSSKSLAIRAELNYFSFCNVYDDNTPHALKRLYELSKAAFDIDSVYLQMNIHNQISYVYYMLDQNQLSAEEGEKALLLSEQLQSDDYEIILFNLIDAYLDAGEITLAEKYIGQLQQSVNATSTAWSQYLLLYAQTYLAFLQQDYQQVLTIKQAFSKLDDFDAPSFIEKRAIFTGLACSALEQYDCLATIMAQYFAAPQWQDINRLTLLELYIKWYSYQQDWDSLARAQQRYFDVTYDKLLKQQQAAKVLGVAKLNNEVIRLNSEKTLKQLDYQNRINSAYFLTLLVVGGLLIIFIFAYLHLKRRVEQQVITVKNKGR